MQSPIEKANEFFGREVAVKGVKPLRDGVQLAMTVGDAPPFTLEKRGGRIHADPKAPKSPDISFKLPPGALDHLFAVHTDDVGVFGVEILKLMASSDPKLKITAKVHIGLFNLLRGGYLGVIPLGGPAVMKFLGTKGLTNMSKIKDAITNLKAQ